MDGLINSTPTTLDFGGMTLVHQFREGEYVTGLCQEGDIYYVRTNEVIYEMIGCELKPIDLAMQVVSRA